MKEITKARIEVLLILFLVLFLLPQRHSETDFAYWTEWALAIHHHGITNIYEHGINYHPVIPYLLYFYDLAMGTPEKIIANINYIKVVPILFDFLPIIVLCCFRQRFIEAKIPYLFLLLNIAYLYNSVCWGQADSMFSSLCFLALVIGLYNPKVAVVLYTLSFYTKFQSIMFLPPLLLVLAYSIRSLKTLQTCILLAAGTAFVILLPFILAGKAGDVFYITTHTVDFMSHVSVQAYNIWYLLIWGNPFEVQDYETFFILTYKQTGLLLFLVASTLTMIPFLSRLLTMRGSKLAPDAALKELMFLTVGLLCFYFFYFNTQMHERYMQPAVILFFFYAVYSRNYIPYILISIAYLMSLEKTFPNFLGIPLHRILFSSRAIALLYTATLAYTMVLFFRRYRLSHEVGKIKLLMNTAFRL